MQIKQLGSFEQSGTLLVYELSNPGLPSTIYFRLLTDGIDMPANALSKVQWYSDEQFQSMLPAAKLELAGLFRVNKYALFSNDIADLTNVYAHYGMLRSGGRSFATIDAIAASDTAFKYEVDFYSLDLQDIFRQYKKQLSNYNLVMQQSFDIAEYAQSGRRLSLQTIYDSNAYSKLCIVSSLQSNVLTVECKDNKGINAAKHIAETLGIAEESIAATCKVSLTCLDVNNLITQQYQIIIARPDYSTDALQLTLPPALQSTVAAKIDIEYVLQLQNIGETISLTDAIVLTDYQVALLHPLTIDNVVNGALVQLVFLADNIGVAGVKVRIDDIDYTTDSLGIVKTTLSIGEHSIAYQYNDKIDYKVISVAAPQTIKFSI